MVDNTPFHQLMLSCADTSWPSRRSVRNEIISRHLHRLRTEHAHAVAQWRAQFAATVARLRQRQNLGQRIAAMMNETPLPSPQNTSSRATNSDGVQALADHLGEELPSRPMFLMLHKSGPDEMQYV